MCIDFLSLSFTSGLARGHQEDQNQIWLLRNDPAGDSFSQCLRSVFLYKTGCTNETNERATLATCAKRLYFVSPFGQSTTRCEKKMSLVRHTKTFFFSNGG